jgi:hypothetical protein
VSREQLYPAGAQGLAVAALDERLDVVADPPRRQPVGQVGHLDRPGREVQPRARLDALVDGRDRDGVGDVVVRDRLAVLVDVDAAMAVVAGQRDERRAAARHREQLLVLLGCGPRQCRTGQARGELDALDEEAVAVVHVGVLVDEPGLRSAEPRLLVLAVEAEDRRRRVQAQVVADGRAADPRPLEQCRGLERAAGDHDNRGPDRDPPRLGAVIARVDRLHPGGAAVLDQHALAAGADEELGAVLECVAQPGLLAGLLRPRDVAEAQVAGGLVRVAVGVGVADDR